MIDAGNHVDSVAMPTPSTPQRRWLLLLIGAVIVLPALTAGAYFGAILPAREAARRVETRCHLKIIGLAMHNFHEANGHFPPSDVSEDAPVHSWMTALLPYLDQAALDKSIQHDLPWTDAANKPAFSTSVPVFLNRNIPTPVADPDGYALAHFAANSRVISDTRRTRIRDITDGTSNTFLMGMVDAGFKPWGDPTNFRDPAQGVKGGPDAFGSPFPKLIFVLMADGSVRAISKSVDPSIFEALGDPKDGRRISDQELTGK